MRSSQRWTWLTVAVLAGAGAALTLITWLSAPAPAARAATRTVTSAADSGPGTLRQALLDAGPGDLITFSPAAFPPGTPAVIPLLSPLPAITQNALTLDASNAGVILEGGAAPAGTTGLV
ncbi:MAG: hypothetical protein KA764_04140, partial [Anaerolineales bacterium]|nr:hypothetical protein [Anaerolineales bacterium]